MWKLWQGGNSSMWQQPRQRCLHLLVVPAFVIVVSIFFLPFEYLWQKASYQVANRKPTGGSTHTIVGIRQQGHQIITLSVVVSNITLSDCVQRYVRIQNRNCISHCETLLFKIPSPGFVFSKWKKRKKLPKIQ